MKMIFAALSVCLGTLLLSTAALATPIPNDFTSQEPDAAAIRSLLERYTRAVSTKDQALFESLLLNKMIPFSSAGQAIKGGATDAGTRNYNDFRQGVFEGPAFTQSFRDIHIEQDGALASVSLVFINSADNGSSWGYKTMQLLKVDGQWRIASEFLQRMRCSDAAAQCDPGVSSHDVLQAFHSALKADCVAPLVVRRHRAAWNNPCLATATIPTSSRWHERLDHALPRICCPFPERTQ